MAAELHEVRVRMPDGVELATDLYLPAATPAPAMLLRTPYGRRELRTPSLEVDIWRALQRGFAIALQDVRGLGGSTGQFDATLSDGIDGAHTIGWIAGQPWCDGRVVTVGASYNGFVQFAAARERPASLMAIAPTMTGSPRAIFYRGGALRLGVTNWAANLVAGSVVAARWAVQESASERAELDGFLAADPLERMHAMLAPGPALAARIAPIRAWWTTAATDPYWQSAAATPAVELPAVHMTGWYDSCQSAAMEAYEAALALSAETERAMPQHLIVGPWRHEPGVTCYPELDLELAYDRESVEWSLDFLCAAIDGKLPGEMPAVRSFVLGRNEWVSLSEWPPQDAAPRSWHLLPSSSRSAGRLMQDAVPEQTSLRYLYDPLDPAPTLGGATSVRGRAGAFDLAALSQRADVLTFSTDPLAEEIEIAGRLALDLTVASSAPATDFVAHLCLRRPTGTIVVLASGVWSGRIADLPLVAGRGDGRRCQLDLGHLHARVRAGEQLALQVTSSDYPELYPNPNTGHDLTAGVPTEFRVAEQTVICGGAGGSVLTLDVRAA
jgi:putative CocE/NonD family hydrolase